MDYDRQDKPAEDPKERIKHFKEFHTPLSKEEQELQVAARFITWYRSGMI